MKINNKTNRLLYVSIAPPPVLRGPPVLMARLLRLFPNNNYAILTQPFEENGFEVDNGAFLPCHYYYTWRINWLNCLKRFPNLMRFFRDILQIISTIKCCLKILRKESINHILLSVDTRSLTLAIYFIHCLTRIPISLYFFDLFVDGLKADAKGKISSWIERKAIKKASNVFVMSEPLRDYYCNKYKIQPVLLHHPIDVPLYYLGNIKTKCDTGGPLKIVFTGLIYEFQLDAILNMVRVVNDMNGVEFHLYSFLSEEKRLWMGITGSNVIFHRQVPQADIPAIQQNSDILFLPIAFNYIYPEKVKWMPPEKIQEINSVGKLVVATASPSKLPEYLVAGRPILIHAPSYSYSAWYGKKHQCAEVVDTYDPTRLRNAISKIKDNINYRNFLVTNARKVAGQHDANKISKKLQSCLGITN